MCIEYFASYLVVGIIERIGKESSFCFMFYFTSLVLIHYKSEMLLLLLLCVAQSGNIASGFFGRLIILAPDHTK